MALKVGELYAELGIKDSKFVKGLKDAKTGLSGVQKGAIAVGAGMVATGAVMGKALSSATTAAKDYGSQVVLLQRLTGATAEESSKWAAVLGRYGIEGKKAALVIKSLSVAIAEQSEDLKALGIATQNADGTNRTTTQVMRDLADTYAEADDKTTVLAAATKALGRGFSDLLPILAGGSKAFDKVVASAEEFGLILTQENIDAYKAFASATKENEQAVKGLAVLVGLATLPMETWKAETLGGILKTLREINPELATMAGGVGSVTVPIVKMSGALVFGISLLPQFAAGLKMIGTLTGAGTTALYSFVGAVAVVDAKMSQITANRLTDSIAKLAEKAGIGEKRARSLARVWVWAQQGPLALQKFAIAEAIDNLTGKTRTFESAVRRAIRALDELKGKGNFSTGGGKGSGGGGGGAGFASGGIATGPTSGYTVKLHGTELITPLGKPMAAQSVGAGDTLNFTFYGMTGMDIREVRAEIEDALASYTSIGRNRAAMGV